MSGDDGQGNGKTVFRPSPLQGLRQNEGVAPPPASSFAPAAPTAPVIARWPGSAG
jgi:hypothetical protein